MAIRAPAPDLQPTRHEQNEKDQQNEATGSAVVHDVSSFVRHRIAYPAGGVRAQTICVQLPA